MNGQVVVDDRDFEASQEKKLEQAIRCTLPQRRANSVMGTRVKKLIVQLPGSTRNSTSRVSASLNQFKGSDFDLNPHDRHLFQYESTMERVRKSIDDNQILDTTPGLNHSNTFNKLLRCSQKDRTKDLGPSAFRYRDTFAERLL